jgi:pimeloyl-ACP methyl ester carboxylesterase
MSQKTILFVHGMFMNALSWANWVAYFEQLGYRCVAPSWPHHAGDPRMLRASHPNPALGRLTFADVVEAIEREIRALPDKPFLIGHSMGGLIVQILLGRNLASAGIALASAPPPGMFSVTWPFIKSNFPVISPFVSKTAPYLMPFDHFQYTFVHPLPLEEQRAAYDAFLIPESRGVPLGALGGIAKIDFAQPRGPLLMIAGSADHICPAAMNRSNYAKYSDTAGVTEFKEFAGRAHFIAGQRGWEEVAAYAGDWLARNAQ